MRLGLYPLAPGCPPRPGTLPSDYAVQEVLALAAAAAAAAAVAAADAGFHQFDGMPLQAQTEGSAHC